MRLFQAGLADPDNRAFAMRSGREGKARHGGEIPMRGFADFMQACIPQPEGEGQTGPVPGG
ncbi:hypothetical protein [Hyphomonas sp.]|uniref:hypothetical protein n=1 Tax=Hyphomonas TaxID=85 RepID=UPI0026C77340